jgi:hypothetical protein
MKPLLAAFTILGFLSGSAGAVPVPPDEPSPEALKQIGARRAALQPLQGTRRATLPPEQLAELERRLQPRLDELAAALAHRDPFIYEAAALDLANDNYRAFAPDKVLALLHMRLKTPETNPTRISAQALILRCLPAAGDQPGVRATLPDLVRLFVDDKADDSLREGAIRASSRPSSPSWGNPLPPTVETFAAPSSRR